MTNPDSPPLRADEMLLSLAGGVRLVVPADLRGISTFVFLEREDWFEDEAPFVRALAPHLRVALDIGANLGFYAATLAAARVPTLAFEPQPGLVDKLRRSARAMPGTQLAVFETALGAEPGIAEFGGETFHEGFRIGTGGTLRVPVARIDDALPAAYLPAIDFAKIDVEGAELAVIAGGQRLFGEGNPLVMIEIRDGNRYDLAPLAALEALGYARYRLIPGLGALVPMAAEPAAPDQLNAFAAKPPRAAALAQSGFLCVPAAVDAIGAGDAHARALAHHARALDRARPASLRAGDLARAFELAGEARAARPSLATDLSSARLLADIGRRIEAAQVLAPHVAAALAGPLDMPDEAFLCPLARYAALRPTHGAGDRLACLVLEAFHALAAPSSLYADPAGREAALERILAAGFAAPETVRRLYLYRLTTGRRAATAPHPLVAAQGPENLNAAFWRQPQLYG